VTPSDAPVPAEEGASQRRLRGLVY
jgi:hypothetical protein